ncbi:MAG: hypothetical protein WD904_12585 [Dehalococcoidia bacterium]
MVLEWEPSNPIRSELVWSPDSSRLAFTAGDGLRVIEVSSGKTLVTVDGYGAAWSPDGSKIAYTLYEGDDVRGIYTVAADGSESARRLTEGSSPTWSPDGSMIAFSH